jgi:hypothetical protein
VLGAAVVSIPVIAGLRGQPHPTAIAAGIAFVVVVMSASVWWTGSFIRSQVRADGKGVLIRDRWHTLTLGWEEIIGFDVVEQPAVDNWWGNPFVWWTLATHAIPVVRLQDGSQHLLLPLTSSIGPDGWDLRGQSIAAVRTVLLTRYHAAVTKPG